MAQIIAIHSFRGGTGKSNLTANLSALIAARGLRVAVIDTDIQSPGIHILFGLHGDQIDASLNDFLWGRRAIDDVALDVTDSLPGPVAGRLFLIPSSIKSGEIARVLREGCDARVLTAGFRRLIQALSLDVLMLDTHPGLNEETLLSLAITQTLVIIMRPDQQDFEGTGVTVEVAAELNVPRTLMIVNKVPAVFEPDAVAAQVRKAFGREVAAVIPHDDELMALGSAGLFALRLPEHPLARTMQRVAEQLLEV